MNHDPAEKNLKHKTDAISWDDIPWKTCDLSFRPPEAEELQLSWGRVIGFLMLTTASAIIGAIVLIWVAPMLLYGAMRIPIWILPLLALIAFFHLKATAKIYFSKVPNARITLLVPAVIVLLVLVAAHHWSVFGLGVTLYLGVGIPLCLLVADQTTGHMIHWHSAHPDIDRNVMIVWRNAWCGRFLEADLEKIDPEARKQMSGYFQHHLFVLIAAGLSVVVGFYLTITSSVQHTGVAILVCFLFLLFAMVVNLGNRTTDWQQLSSAWGHWFYYQSDGRQPPWVLRSPAGSYHQRLTLTLVAVSCLAIAIVILSLADASRPHECLADLWDLSSARILTSILIALVLTPIHLILLWSVVVVPTTQACWAATQPQETK